MNGKRIVIVFALISFVSICNGSNKHGSERAPPITQKKEQKVKDLPEPPSPDNVPKQCSIERVEQFPNGINKHTRIIGGKGAPKHAFPWSISLSEYDTHFCGGVLIDEQFVLTAAHCAQGYTGGISVLAGINKLSEMIPQRNETDLTSKGQERRVADSRTHESYSYQTISSDIALLKMNKPFKLNEAVQPIKLTPKGEEYTGCCAVSGWGMSDYPYGTSSTDHLQVITLPILNNTICDKFIKDIDSSAPPYNKTTQMCAGYAEGNVDACQGDSGGPFMCGKKGRIYLVGLVSWGIKCAYQKSPGIYTKLSYYIDWINEAKKSMTPMKKDVASQNKTETASGNPSGSKLSESDNSAGIVKFTFSLPSHFKQEKAESNQDFIRQEVHRKVLWYFKWIPLSTPSLVKQAERETNHVFWSYNKKMPWKDFIKKYAASNQKNI